MNTETMLPAEPQLRQAPQASPTSCWLLLYPFHLQGCKTIVKDAAVCPDLLCPCLGSRWFPRLILLTSPGKAAALSAMPHLLWSTCGLPHTLSWMYMVFPIMPSCLWGRPHTGIHQLFVHSEGNGEDKRELPVTMEPGRNDRASPLCPLLLHKSPLLPGF